MAFLLFLTAFVLSGIAAYYSIIGLIAIFSAAVIPVAVMGSSLEIAKLVVASWLYRYWKHIPILMKAYFTIALLVLMLVTSMGIFGFLSKAHSDQSLVSGDVIAKIAIYDEKIKVAKENIDANRKALKQMDEAVDQVMARSTTEQGADRAVQIRRSQSKERTRLLQEIEAEQKKITALNEERAPIAAEVRKVEAEVGPIKYIAALIYGDNPDSMLLERAVRWLIILLIFVFDPLAVLMLIAANLTQIRKSNWTAPKEPPVVEVPKEHEPLAADTSIQSIDNSEVIRNNAENNEIIPDSTVESEATQTVAKLSSLESNEKNSSDVALGVDPIPQVETTGVKEAKRKKSTRRKKENLEVKKEEVATDDKSDSQGVTFKPVSIEDQVQSMIENNDQEGLEQTYKQIVKVLAKKNRSKSTHWGPIKNIKNG